MSCPYGAQLQVLDAPNGVNAVLSGPVNTDAVSLFVGFAASLSSLKGQNAVVTIDLTAIIGVWDSAIPGFTAVANATAAMGATLHIITADPDVIATLQRYGFGPAIYSGP